MTPPYTYQAKRLLERGPMTACEFSKAIGWPYRVAARALQQLRDTGITKMVKQAHGKRQKHKLV